MEPERETVAGVLAQRLRQAGIVQVFGLPGGENTAILEALRREDIEFYLVRNESSALFMAAAAARLTGRPAVCLTTLGPGATNAYVGVAHAYLDRAPVLLLTAQSPDHFQGRHTHQVLDLQAIFAPVTKQTDSVTPENVHHIVDDALQLCVQDRPGPVHLGIAGDVATLPAAPQHSIVEKSLPSTSVRAEPSAIDPARIVAARTLLSRAERPVIVAGLGLEPEAPYTALRELAEAAGAPVIDTPKAKGALSADHPLFAGTIGLTQHDPAYAVLDEADCVIALGFDVVEAVRIWQSDAPLIWLAPWRNEDPAVPAAIEMVGAMGPILQQLVDSDFSTTQSWGAARVADHRDSQAAPYRGSPAAGKLWPQQVLECVRAAVPPEQFISTDVGSHKIMSALAWPALDANRYMVSNGLSAMGFGLCAAIAAALILEEAALCITGDAGFSMVMGELGLAVEKQLPVICIVMNDSALDLIRANQLRNERPVFGTEFTNPDFALIAQAYGVDHYRITNLRECSDAIATAMQRAQPALIEAMIDPASYPTTPKTDSE